MEMKILFCNHCNKRLVSLRFYHSNKKFKIVYTFMLLKSSYNLTSFISFDIIANILHAFKSPFCCQNMLICWAFNKLSNFINNKRIVFYLYSFFLFASFASLHCFFKVWFIRHKAFSFACNTNKLLKDLR